MSTQTLTHTWECKGQLTSTGSDDDGVEEEEAMIPSTILFVFSSFADDVHDISFCVKDCVMREISHNWKNFPHRLLPIARQGA